MRRFVPLLVACAALAACDSTAPGTAEPNALSSAAATLSPLADRALSKAPTLETNVPVYPAVVLYVVYREYVNKHPGRSVSPESRHYTAYMERRLRALYPDRGYDGMLEDARAGVEAYVAAYAAYEAALDRPDSLCLEQPLGGLDASLACDGGGGGGGGGGAPAPYTPPYTEDGSWAGREEVDPLYPDGYVPTIEEEAAYMHSTPEEKALMYRYEEIARGEGAEALLREVRAYSDIEGPQASSQLEPSDGVQISPAVWVAGASAAALLVVGTGYVFFRAHQTAERARSKAELYYPQRTFDGAPGDAYRHILWSVLLRRYLTGPIAVSITNYRETSNSNNTPRDKYMDLHNNRLGRETLYNHFRGHWLHDRWNWKKWARTARDFVNDGGNRVVMWSTNPSLTYEQARVQQGAVPAYRYIVYVP